MRIERAELRVIRLPLKIRFETSSGAITQRTLLLVTLYGEGLEGQGECVAPEFPLYTEETVASARAVLSDVLIPRVVSRSFPNPEVLARELGFVRGNAMARAALEMAFWDLWARSLGQPLWKLLGGVRQRVPAGVSLGIEPTLEATLDAVERHVADGYSRIKLKIKPGWDVQVVAAVRDRFPDVALTVDANGAYSMADLPVFLELDRFKLDYIEQPLAPDDLHDHAALQARIQTPICLDESVRSARDARKALAAGAARVLNVKPGRVGGLGEARRVHDVAEAFEVPVWVGGMLETGVGRAHNLHLATLPNFRKPGDMASASRYWKTDLVHEPLEAQGGWMAVPDGPGIGVTLNRPLVEQVTLDRQEWRA